MYVFLKNKNKKIFILIAPVPVNRVDDDSRTQPYFPEHSNDGVEGIEIYLVIPTTIQKKKKTEEFLIFKYSCRQ